MSSRSSFQLPTMNCPRGTSEVDQRCNMLHTRADSGSFDPSLSIAIAFQSWGGGGRPLQYIAVCKCAVVPRTIVARVGREHLCPTCNETGPKARDADKRWGAEVARRTTWPAKRHQGAAKAAPRLCPPPPPHTASTACACSRCRLGIHAVTTSRFKPANTALPSNGSQGGTTLCWCGTDADKKPCRYGGRAAPKSQLKCELLAHTSKRITTMRMLACA